MIVAKCVDASSPSLAALAMRMCASRRDRALMSRVEAGIDGFQNIRRSSEDVWRRVVVVVVVVVLEDVSHACSR